MIVHELDTALGLVTLRVEKGLLWGIGLPGEGPGPQPHPGGRGLDWEEAPIWLARLAADLRAHLSGQPVVYQRPPLPPPPTPFAQAVLEALFELPWGHRTTYGELARAAGHPGAARAVGSVMAQNPWPLLFPCHRVLAAGGGLGGFRGGLELKTRLLQLEAQGWGTGASALGSNSRK
jgi:methylated-DNA-[protein]-cysteine S-methyltransferase